MHFKEKKVNMKFLKAVAIGFVCLGASSFAQADTIDPTSYVTTLEVGETSTIRKTVVVEAAGTTSALIDVMFLVDTTGSMGDEIAEAQARAAAVLTTLSGFGDFQSGVAFYHDSAGVGILNNLTSDDAVSIASVNTLSASGGGDFPEKTYEAIVEVSENAAWRTGSNRYIIVLGDASSLLPPSIATTIAALDAEDINLIGVDFAGSYMPEAFTDSIEAVGGTVYDGGDDGSEIASAIEDGVTNTFAEYSTVDVSDLGGGLPGVGVSSVCVSADTGACVGTTATGMYDRSIDRTFEFDVTFTALEDGVHAFDTFALVDSGIVATEADRITVSSAPPPPPPPGIPEPTSIALFSLALLGIVANRRKNV